MAKCNQENSGFAVFNYAGGNQAHIQQKKVGTP